MVIRNYAMKVKASATVSIACHPERERVALSLPSRSRAKGLAEEPMSNPLQSRIAKVKSPSQLASKIAKVKAPVSRRARFAKVKGPAQGGGRIAKVKSPSSFVARRGQPSFSPEDLGR